MKAYTKNIKFGDIEIQKQKFHHHKGSISIKNIDIDKIELKKKFIANQYAIKKYLKAERKFYNRKIKKKFLIYLINSNFDRFCFYYK